MMEELGGDCGWRFTLRIQRLGAPILRRAAEPVTEIAPMLRDLSDQMFGTMYGAAGQGLAAPQVGHGLRLAVVDVPTDGRQLVLVNPHIAWVSRDRARGVEGCLSIPGVRAVVERSAEVVVEALDLDGVLQTIGADGDLARCLQHEIDHLDGILYVDRLSPLARSMALAEYRKSTRTRN